MNVHQKHFRPSSGVAVIDADVPQAGWLHLDLPRTLGGVKRSYGWPVGLMSARLTLPGSALGGTQVWAVAARPPVEEPHAPPSDAETAGAAASEQVQSPEQAPEPASESRPSEPRGPRRIPKSDIIVVRRRAEAVRPAREISIQALRAIVREPPQPARRSFLVPKLRSRLRPWLTAVAALAMVGISFCGGAQWSRWQVSAAPLANGSSAAG